MRHQFPTFQLDVHNLLWKCFFVVLRFDVPEARNLNGAVFLMKLAKLRVIKRQDHILTSNFDCRSSRPTDKSYLSWPPKSLIITHPNNLRQGSGPGNLHFLILFWRQLLLSVSPRLWSHCSLGFRGHNIPGANALVVPVPGIRDHGWGLIALWSESNVRILLPFLTSSCLHVGDG